MTTTELIELLKKYERGGATGRPREVMFEVDDRIIDTDGIDVIGSVDGLITELYLSLPSASDIIFAPTADVVEVVRCKDCVNCAHLVYKYDRNEEWWCGGLEVVPDGFCNYGERKEDVDTAD